MIKLELQKKNLKLVLILIVIMFFSFQRILAENLSFFKYFDELFAIEATIEIITTLILGKKIFNNRELFILLCLFITFILGILSNYHSSILTNKFLIIVDIISIEKVILAYYWIRLCNLSRSEADTLLILLVKTVQITILIMALYYIVSTIFNLNTNNSFRYGLYSYKFFFNNAGNYSKFFYFSVPLLTAGLYYSNTTKDKFYIGLSLFIWLTTLRTRAFAFVFLYIAFYIWFFTIKKSNVNRINIKNIIPFCFILLLIGKKQLMFYFLKKNQARGVLLRNAILTAKTYFPIGSGFGTYGSNVAATHYSPLYTLYKFNKIYGMGYIHTGYLNDNYWPMLLGQFGILGLLLMTMAIYTLYKQCITYTRENTFFYIATLYAFAFLIISSIASKSYSEFSMIVVFLLHGLLVQREINI